jgi:hypothetical protein
LTLFFYKYSYKGYKEIKMKSLSQSEYGELRDLYSSVYAPKADTILEGFTDEDLDLTDEEIEEQVEEVFLECIEEGYDIDEIERAIYEAVDAELEVLNEVTSPAKVAVARMKNKSSASGGEGSGDAGAKARAKLNVSKQKIGGSSEKKASTLSKVKGAVSKVKSGLKTAGKVAQGGVGVASRAVGTAQRAASAVKGAAKKGYERGRYGAGGKSSSSSSSSSDGGSSSGGGSSSSSSSSSGGSSSASGGDSSSSGSSDAPKKRKDGLLKRGLKKIVRGAAKVVSTGAGAVKAGADYVSNRARKESMNHTDVKTIQELYNSIYESQQVDEELIDEDSRRMSNKQHTARVRGNIERFKNSKVEYTPPSNYDPDANRGKGEVLTRKQIEKKRRKALRQEELEATGLFSEKEIEAIMEADSLAAMQARREKRLARQRKQMGTSSTGQDFGHDYGISSAERKKRQQAEFDKFVGKKTKKEEVEVDEAMSSYDRNRKRAAQRAAARNAARDAGKTGVVPGVGYVTPRRERETYVDSAGTTRHKSGAKMPKD